MNLRFLLLLLAVCTAPARGDSADAVLDALHGAGAASDPVEFLAQLTAEAVVLGVAGTGPLEGLALRRYFNERFAGGDSWSYRSVARAVQLSADGSTAWFNESLENAEGSPSWGSGVLIRTAGSWKIAQYAMGPVREGGVNSGESSAETAEAVLDEPGKKKTCRRIRHKTNKVSNC